MTFPNPKWQPAVSDTLDAAAAVDKGGGEVGLPITGHTFLAEQVVIVAGTVNYDGAYPINSITANEIVITATYVAEVFAGTETVVFGRQPIVKEDFLALEAQISGQSTTRLQPPLVWVDNATVRVEATADCPVSTQLNGLPNILNPVNQVSGGLSDGIVRSITANVSCILSAGGLYGTTQTEKSSQWYAVYAIAADADTDFTLKALPIMRVKSQASQTISLGNLGTPATGIGYGFTTDDLVGGKIYMLSSANNRGLMRTISANNNDDATGGAITYTGDALTVAEGDWFVVLPNTNFRWLGTFWNNSSGHIEAFYRFGEWVWWGVADLSGSHSDVGTCCPLATLLVISAYWNGVDQVSMQTSWGLIMGTQGNTDRRTWFVPLQFCSWLNVAGQDPKKLGYAYPPGTGF